MQDATTQRLEHMRQGARQIAQRAGRRNDVETALVESSYLGRKAGRGAFGAAQCTREDAVDDVGRAQVVWVNGDAEIAALRPDLMPALIGKVGLGAEVADLKQRQVQRPLVTLSDQ